jgi:hypothetical protein
VYLNSIYHVIFDIPRVISAFLHLDHLLIISALGVEKYSTICNTGQAITWAENRSEWRGIIIRAGVMLCYRLLIITLDLNIDFKKSQISFPDTGKAHIRPRTPHLCIRKGQLM